MAGAFQAIGKNAKAPFKLKVHRGEGMALLAMNWKRTHPPDDFVGFAIEYREPNGKTLYALNNRIGFANASGQLAATRSTRLSPIQKFRWVHFPRNADLKGQFTYRVTPVFMNAADELSYGESQEVAIELARETHPGKLNVAFTRGFVSSQAFVDKFGDAPGVGGLLPAKANQGLDFTPTHPKAKDAYAWMGFEARRVVLEVLDDAINDPKAQVFVLAYDLNEPDIVSRLEKLGGRVKLIIDDDGEHGSKTSAECKAEARLAATAGKANVQRQHVGQLQHNKTIVVDSRKTKVVVCGSTNMSWRGFFVQSNNAIVMRGPKPVKVFREAFDAYWNNPNNASAFGSCVAARLAPLGIRGIDAQLGFAPYSSKNAMLQKIAGDVSRNTTSSLLFSLAFLSQTPGKIRDAIVRHINTDDVFVYGISDRGVDDKAAGIVVQKPSGQQALVSFAALTKNVPPPFKREPTGGGGVFMHHKFIVLDFDKPTARVYMGSYNFSESSDRKNGENLLLIRDRRVATSYMVEALRIFDHYHFRASEAKAQAARKALTLQRPPRQAGEVPWWQEHYTDPKRIRDRKLFS